MAYYLYKGTEKDLCGKLHNYDEEKYLKEGQIYYFPKDRDFVNISLDDIKNEVCFSQERFRGNLTPRLEKYYGEEVKFRGKKYKDANYPPLIRKIKELVEEKIDEKFDGVLINYYRNGDDIIDWHHDKETAFKNLVVSLSFGSSRTFYYKHNEEKYRNTLQVNHGDAIIFDKKFNRNNKHAILKEAVEGERINLTFR